MVISRALKSLTMSLVTADYGGVSQQKCLCVLTIIWWFDVSDVCGSVGWIMAQDVHIVLMTPDAHLHSVSEDLVDFGSDTVAGFKPAGLAVKHFLRLQPLSLLAAGIRITSRGREGIDGVCAPWLR